MAFLTTRVKPPDVDNEKQIITAIQYLRDTKDLVLTLKSDRPKTVHWWADDTFAAHHDMRSHTGGMLSIGKGAVYVLSTRQQLNTKSSTEA